MTSNFPGCHCMTIQPSSRGPTEIPKHRLPPFRPTPAMPCPAMPPRPTTVRWSARHSPRPRAGEGRRRLNEITGQVSVAGARVCLHLNLNIHKFVLCILQRLHTSQVQKDIYAGSCVSKSPTHLANLDLPDWSSQTGQNMDSFSAHVSEPVF